jgi:hypothetical protein
LLVEEVELEQAAVQVVEEAEGPVGIVLGQDFL